MVKISYKPGDKVFAKVKGYPPWPAQVVSDTGKKKYNVLFYGTQETGAIKPEDLSFYLKYKNSYVHKYLKRAGYEDAVKQIEDAIKKDGGDGNDASNPDDSLQDIELSDTSSSVSSPSEKKAPKRKGASLPPDEPPAKRAPGKGRKSIAAVDSKEDNSEELASKPKQSRRKSNTSSTGEENSEEIGPKASRRKSSASTESKDDDEEESKKSIDDEDENNGIKEETPDEQIEQEEETKNIGPTISQKLDDTEQLEDTATSNDESNSTIIENVVEKDETTAITKTSKDSDKDKTEGEAAEKPKEPEFVEIKTNIDDTMQMEEEEEVAEPPPEKAAPKAPVKVEIISDKTLKNFISYAEHVKEDASAYKDKPVEPRRTRKDDVFAVKLPSGVVCGVKLHKEWPLAYSNEHDMALYEEKVAKLVLEVAKLLKSGQKAPHEVELDVIPDIQMTTEDIQEICYAREIESKRKKLTMLKKEADLVTLDSKIKNNLGLDKALPEAGLQSLKEFQKLYKHINPLMLKKHPHVLDTVRRLRQYVGNLKEWDMSDEDVESFVRTAEKIRNEAEKIYVRIMEIFEMYDEPSTFWDTFMDAVADFRTKCKDLSESEILALSAEPDSRQAFFENLEEVVKPEVNNPPTTTTSSTTTTSTTTT